MDKIVCDKCQHNIVCKFKDGLLQLVEDVNAVSDNKHDIHSVEVSCDKYSSIQKTFNR